MNEPTRPEWREALRRFRERMGGLTEAKKARQKAHREARTLITAAVKSGAKSVPAIARETQLPSPDVLWHVMAMKRGGDLREAGRAGDYYLYALKEREP
jgi:hypothetical protein